MTQTWLKLFPLWVTSNLVNKERKGYSRWRYKGVDKVSWVFLEKDQFENRLILTQGTISQAGESSPELLLS